MEQKQQHHGSGRETIASPGGIFYHWFGFFRMRDLFQAIQIARYFFVFFSLFVVLVDFVRQFSLVRVRVAVNFRN